MGDDAQAIVKEMLLDQATAEDPITSREISDQVEKDEVGSFPQPRMLSRDIMIEDKIPILTSNQG